MLPPLIRRSRYLGLCARSLAPPLAFALLLNGCAAMSETGPQFPETLYDAVVTDSTSGNRLRVGQLAERLGDIDVVVFGEFHGHQAAHLLQARLQQSLYQQNPAQILSMEQFNADHQHALDRYLQGETGEEELIEDAEAWANYRASYRPLVEFARQQGIPVIAANAPAGLVRCVGRKGPDYLEQLPADRRQWLPDQPFRGSAAYRARFFEALAGGHGGDISERMENSFRAQLLRDNTMASRILQSIDEHPGHQVLHLTGTFHSEERLGTVEALLASRPGLRVAVISPVPVTRGQQPLPVSDNAIRGDYLYFVLPLPEEYRDPERQRKAMMEQFSKAASRDCD